MKEPSIEQLRKNYEGFNDGKLIKLAIEGAQRLRPEALELLKEIIKERGLSENILKGIDAQFQEIDHQVLSEYTDLLRKLPCPVCNSSKEKLNATITGKVVSFIVFTNYEKEVKVACPDCLDKQNKDAMVKSVLLGWWGIPWGIARTIRALIFNTQMKKQNRLTEANDTFNAFVLERIGCIETNKNNPAALQELIKHIS